MFTLIILKIEYNQLATLISLCNEIQTRNLQYDYEELFKRQLKANRLSLSTYQQYVNVLSQWIESANLTDQQMFVLFTILFSKLNIQTSKKVQSPLQIVQKEKIQNLKEQISNIKPQLDEIKSQAQGNTKQFQQNINQIEKQIIIEKQQQQQNELLDKIQQLQSSVNLTNSRFILNNHEDLNNSPNISSVQKCNLNQAKNIQQLINNLQQQQISQNIVIKSREEKDDSKQILFDVKEGKIFNIENKIHEFEEEQMEKELQKIQQPTYEEKQVETDITLEDYDKTIEDYHYQLDQNEQKEKSISNLTSIRYNQSEEIKELTWKLKDNIKLCQQLKQQLKQTEEELDQQKEEANEQFTTQETNYNQLKDLYQQEQIKYQQIQEDLQKKIDIIAQMSTMKNSVNTLNEIVNCINSNQFENAEQMLSQIITILKAGEVDFDDQ